MSFSLPPLRPGDIDMNEIARLVRAAGVPALIQNTGGGTAVLFAGEPAPDSDGELRNPAAAGPGRFFPDPVAGWAARPTRGRLDDFTIGPDDAGQGDTDARTATELGVRSAAQAAAVVLAQARTAGRVLTVAEGRQAVVRATGR